MIADIRHRPVPPFEALPVTAQSRLITAFTLLADSSFYAHSLGERGSDARFALRLVGLLRAGVIRPDCGWLLAAGFIELVAPANPAQAIQTPTSRKKHRHGRMRDLDEQTLVVLTA